MSVVSAVEYARNAAAYHLLPDLAITLRRPGAQRGALLSRPVAELSGATVLRDRVVAHLGAAARAALPPPVGSRVRTSPRRARSRPTSTRSRGLPHEAVLVIGDAALHARRPKALSRTARPGRRVEGSGPDLPFVFAVWAARREADAVGRRRPSIAGCSSPATGGWRTSTISPPRPRRATGYRAPRLSRLSRRSRLRLVVPPPRRSDGLLPPTGAGRAGSRRTLSFITAA